MTFLTRAVAWLITILTAFFHITGTPTLRREAPLRVTAYIVCKSAEAVEAMDRSHLDCLTDIIIFETTAFGTEGQIETKPDFGQIVEKLRAMTEKRHASSRQYRRPRLDRGRNVRGKDGIPVRNAPAGL